MGMGVDVGVGKSMSGVRRLLVKAEDEAEEEKEEEEEEEEEEIVRGEKGSAKEISAAAQHKSPIFIFSQDKKSPRMQMNAL